MSNAERLPQLKSTAEAREHFPMGRSALLLFSVLRTQIVSQVSACSLIYVTESKFILYYI